MKRLPNHRFDSTLAMSSATPLAKPFSKPISQCPYCDHVSPPGSKFCGECGAALHLQPCPHCGAVNDITVAKACYRCHGDLPGNSVPVPSLEPEPESAPVTPALSAPINATYSEVAAEPSSRQRPHVWVVGIVLIAFAAASYYAYRQRTALVPGMSPPSETVQAEKKAPDPAPASTLPIKKLDPAPAPAIISPLPEKTTANDKPPIPPKRETIATEPTTPSSTNPSARSINNRAATRREATPTTPTLPANDTIVTPNRARPDTASGLAPVKPNIGPCTEAVAALGLCTQDPNARR